MLRFIRRLVLIVVVLVVVSAVAGGIWLATHRDEARAWRQVTTIGAQLTDLGAVDGLGERLARDTTPAKAVTVGALPSTLVAPGDGEPAHPAVALLVPEGTDGTEERRVRDVQHALASARMSAWAVRVPSDEDALVDPTAAVRVEGALGAIAAHPSTSDRHVSVLAIGPTASLVLVAAADGAIADDIEAIVAVQPIADVRGLVGLATTGAFVDETGRVRRVEARPELRESAGRAVLQTVRRELPKEGRVVDALLDAAEASPDPIAALKVLPDSAAGPRLAPILAVLRTESPAEFDAAWDRLPESFRTAALERSPLPIASRVRARVLVVQATDDEWARSDVARLASTLPDARTLEVDAADPAGLVDDPRAIRDVLSVSAWWLQRAGA